MPLANTTCCENLPTGRLNVVHVITDLQQGGAEAMLEKLLMTSRVATPEVFHSVISLRSIGTVGARLRTAGVEVRALGASSIGSLLDAMRQLTIILRATPAPTVVQTWMYHADLLGGWAARRAQRPVIWNIRQTGLSQADIGRLTRMVVRACGAMSGRVPSRILCNSKAAIDVHTRMGYDTQRFLVIPNGFDTTKFARNALAASRLRAEWGLDDHHIAVGFVARLDPQKDHANFVQAAAIAASQRPDLRFVLVGRGIPENPPLRAAIAEARLTERFILEGQRTDIANVMSALDIFCMSSRAEGFPNVLGEAMACETPAVTTDCGDARVLLGDDARVVPVQDPEALARLVVMVASLTPAQRRQMGAQQRHRVSDHYDIRQVWKAYLALYRETVDAQCAGLHR